MPCVATGLRARLFHSRKKHQILKSCGLVDRQKGKLSEYGDMQRSLSKRLLEAVVDQSQKFGLGTWALDAPRAATHALQSKFNAQNLHTSKSATLHRVQISADGILFCGSDAVLVHGCYHCSSMGLFFEVSPLQKMQHHAWGTEWKMLPTNKQILLAKKTRKYGTPMWHRWTQRDMVQCLH